VSGGGLGQGMHDALRLATLLSRTISWKIFLLSPVRQAALINRPPFLLSCLPPLGIVTG
jgi:hypothetical protein